MIQNLQNNKMYNIIFKSSLYGYSFIRQVLFNNLNFIIIELHMENPLYNLKLIFHKSYPIVIGITLNYADGCLCITLLVSFLKVFCNFLCYKHVLNADYHNIM